MGTRLKSNGEENQKLTTKGRGATIDRSQAEEKTHHSKPKKRDSPRRTRRARRKNREERREKRERKRKRTCKNMMSYVVNCGR